MIPCSFFIVAGVTSGFVLNVNVLSQITYCVLPPGFDMALLWRGMRGSQKTACCPASAYTFV